MHSLEQLFMALSSALDGDLRIEKFGSKVLAETANKARTNNATALVECYLKVLNSPDAHSCCSLIATTPLPWAEPATSSDPDYVALNDRKTIVELVGPEGIVERHDIRMGLYGISPNTEYGIRCHPAEEVFVMLAGEAEWIKGDSGYEMHGVGARRHHPSMINHATRTRDNAFMSLYIWQGDVSFDEYNYQGTPKENNS